MFVALRVKMGEVRVETVVVVQLTYDIDKPFLYVVSHLKRKKIFQIL